MGGIMEETKTTNNLSYKKLESKIIKLQVDISSLQRKIDLLFKVVKGGK